MNAVESLVSSLLNMAEAKTNPVLEIIDLEQPLEEDKKYPANLLQFNQSGWRGYYHCHPTSRAGNHRFKGEHGHFHLFVRIKSDPETWSHLAALAMDNIGQPLGWFTVNHWVTGEAWSNADELVDFLSNVPHQQQNTLVEQWLLSLLAVSREMLSQILYERDKVIETKQNDSEGEDIRQNRALYLLTKIPMNLKKMLENLDIYQYIK